MKRSRRLSRLADLEGEAGLQQLRSLLNTPLGKNNTVVMSRMALEKRSIPEISFPDLFHALSLTQSIPLFTPVLPPPCSKYLQTTPSMSTSSSACSSSKTINLKKRVPSFLSSPDSCDWNFNDIPSSDEPVAPTVITVPTPPTGVAPTRYVVSKRRVLVCTKVKRRRNDTNTDIVLKNSLFSFFLSHSFLWSVNYRWIKCS